MTVNFIAFFFVLVLLGVMATKFYFDWRTAMGNLPRKLRICVAGIMCFCLYGALLD